jgi:hypothetical protein
MVLVEYVIKNVSQMHIRVIILIDLSVTNNAWKMQSITKK